MSRWRKPYVFFLFLILILGCTRLCVRAFKLPSPPEYCSKDMDLNAIPALSESLNASFNTSLTENDVELLQVQVLIRHGARTPWGPILCWDGYDHTWDCNVTEVVAPSPGAGSPPENLLGLFQKTYDAYPSNNLLGGTCMLGQLIDEGFEQEKQNGLHLRSAYICEGPACLFANTSVEEAQGALYLRSDDEQRTVMSGQILTASMFNMSSSTVLPWHTGDDEIDYIAINENICPRLWELEAESKSSKDYIDRLESAETLAFNKVMDGVWGRDRVESEVLDCLMTTACTGKRLPQDMTEEIFQDATELTTWMATYVYLYNDSAYAKLAMAQLVLEVRTRLQAAMNGSSPHQFVLYSGHDDTLMPFLAAIAPEAWDAKWARYASLLAIELLRVGVGGDEAADDDSETDTVHYFRVVYNGKVLRLHGCNEDVCPIKAFFDATEFAEVLQDTTLHCSTQVESTPPPTMLSTAMMSPSPSLDTGATGCGTGEESLSPTPTPANSSLGGIGVVGGNDSVGLGHSVLGVGVALFVIGVFVGSFTAVRFSRRFSYEPMIEGRSSAGVGSSSVVGGREGGLGAKVTGKGDESQSPYWSRGSNGGRRGQGAWSPAVDSNDFSQVEMI